MKIEAINYKEIGTDNQGKIFEVRENDKALFIGTQEECKNFIMQEGLQRTIKTIKKHSDVFKRLADR
jgi:hypothetical protein